MILKKNISLFIFSLVSVLFSAVMLSSFSAYDATWISASTVSRPTNNLLGSWGANGAALLFFFLGISAYLFIPFFLFLAFFFLHNKKFADEWDAFLGWGVLFLTGSATSALYHVSLFPPLSAGGLIGQAIAGWCSGSDRVLVKLFFATTTFMSIALVSRFSFICVARYSITFFSYVFHKDRVLRPLTGFVVRCLSCLLGAAKLSVFTIASFIQSLITGTFIEPESTIVTFELDDVLAELLNVQQDDELLQQGVVKAMEAPEKLPDMPADTPQKGTEDLRYGTSKKERVPTRPEKPQYILPNARLFPKSSDKIASDAEQKSEQQLARVLEEKLARFGVVGSVVSIKSGPVITLFEYQPDIDAKISKIIALEDDLALALQAVSIRIIAPIPGRSVVGFEVAKKKRRNVLFSSSIHAADFQQFSGELPLVFGQDTVGNNVVVDLISMPHLLVAGSTGSGKSVALNTMLMSLLYRKTPDELRLILIDPKRLEFASYADIGHLLFPIVTDPKDAAPVLQWVVQTMEQRYQKMSTFGVRNIFDYEVLRKEHVELERMPYLVVIIDELADLMMTAGKEVEGLIARIAQMARAAGIHMILATQRPSVDVITGLIKVNFPSRVSFRVTSKVDSRTILDCAGAEKLLGKGDMLFLDSSSSSLRRVHGAYVSDQEITNLVSYIRAQQKPQYIEIRQIVELQQGNLLEGDDGLYKEVVTFVKTVDEISISLIQRRFRIGYNRSARIIEMLEIQGVILPSDGSKMRKVVH